MRLRSLLLAVSFLLPLAAYADPIDTNPSDFTTTITGGGNIIVFPNVGGPSHYTYYTRVNQIDAEPLYVYVNDGPITQGRMIFNLSSNPYYQDVSFDVPASAGQPEVSAALFGPNLITNIPGIGFYVLPGTYNLTDASGNPYTYTVTQASPVPEPSPLALLTTSIVCLIGFTTRQRLQPSA